MITFLKNKIKSFSNIVSIPKQDEYKLLEYIKTNGTQYIDTGILAKSNLSIEIDCNFAFNNNTSLFGAADGDGSKNRIHLFYYQNQQIYYYYASSGYPYVKFSNFGRHVYKISNNILYIDGEQKLNAGTSSTFSSSSSIYLFAVNFNGQAFNNSIVRFYSCRIWDDDILVRDYIPVEKNGIACLYDKIEGKFYYSNAASFDKPTFSSKSYYVQSSGSQYIDTDILLTPTTSMELNFEKVGNVINWERLFGIWNGGHVLQMRRYQATNTWQLVQTNVGQKDFTLNSNTIYNLKVGNGKYYLDDTLIASYSVSFSTTQNLRLFHSEDQYGIFKLYNCKIYDEDILIKNIVPAMDNEKTPCLLDTINNKYYYPNAGSLISNI